MTNPMSGLRHYTVISLAMGPVIVVLGGALDLIGNRYGVGKTIALALALAVVGVQHTRYLWLSLRHVPEDRRWLEHAATFAVALGSWAVVAGSDPSSGLWVLVPAAVIAHVAMLTSKAERLAVVFGGTAATIAVGAAVATDFAASDVLMIALLVGTLVFLDVTTLWFWRLVQELDRARDTAKALAVAEERLRFAADLHDIQGHNLQAIALKGELTERLIGRDDDTARKLAAEIADLARTALAETREVVQGYRRADLDTEIANAVGILEAVGITTTVVGDANEVPEPLRQLFGALVREGTTNVLRHSKAERCTVLISVREREVRVRLRNDGVTGVPEERDGSGLAGLRERFATVGGTVDAGVAAPNGFELSGRVEVTA
ncbi:sensor histidine kinase [Umezawaea sp. NPDC059074]|uniref:sensor histidine kinase n=1 Tax=Umezawaea sp. NPDC059074 TaxID=3346716 RepID=UPI0036932FC8